MKITLKDERASDPQKKERVFHFLGGIIDYVRYLNADKTVLSDDVIYLEDTRDDVICRAAVQYNDGYTESLFSYVNNIPTPEGGTHETGFKSAFTKVSMITHGASACSRKRIPTLAARTSVRV